MTNNENNEKEYKDLEDLEKDFNKNWAEELRKNKKALLAAGVLVIIVILGLVIGPGLTGFITYQDDALVEEYKENVSALKSKVSMLSTNLSSYAFFNQQLLNKLDNYSSRISSLNSKLNTMKIKLNSTKEKYNETVEELQEELDEVKDNLENKKGELENVSKTLNEKLSNVTQKLNKSKEDYNILSENWANNLCCKEKVDNPNIEYYKIRNNTIICLEEGELEIDC